MKSTLFVLTISLLAANAGTKKADLKWLEDKAKEEGVTKLDSGLMYKVLKAGKAWAKSPLASTTCTCKYAGKLTNGKQFDAGEIDFAPNQVIAGWTEVRGSNARSAVCCHSLLLLASSRVF